MSNQPDDTKTIEVFLSAVGDEAFQSLAHRLDRLLSEQHSGRYPNLIEVQVLAIMLGAKLGDEELQDAIEDAHRWVGPKFGPHIVISVAKAQERLLGALDKLAERVKQVSREELNGTEASYAFAVSLMAARRLSDEQLLSALRRVPGRAL